MTDVEPVLRTYQVDINDEPIMGGGEKAEAVAVGFTIAITAGLLFVVAYMWAKQKDAVTPTTMTTPTTPTDFVPPAPVYQPIYIEHSRPVWGHSSWSRPWPRPWSRPWSRHGWRH